MIIMANTTITISPILGYFVLMLAKSQDFFALRLISSKYLEYNTKTTCLFYEVMIQAQRHL